MSPRPKAPTHLAAEIAGWYGAIAIVFAYFLVSMDIVASDGAIYQLLNLSGAIGLISIALVKHVKQSVVLNIFWSAIAIIALLRISF